MTHSPNGDPPGTQPSVASQPQVAKPGYSGSGPGTPPPTTPPPSSATLTEEEKKSIRNAAFGAVFLVTQADPGFLDMIKESFAASKAFAGSAGPVREILTHGGMPAVPKLPPDQLEGTILPALNQAMVLVNTKDPQELDAFRFAILGACEQVAQASGDVADTESATIQKIKAAMGM